jgi:hypothetical protein
VHAPDAVQPDKMKKSDFSVIWRSACNRKARNEAMIDNRIRAVLKFIISSVSVKRKVMALSGSGLRAAA